MTIGILKVGLNGMEEKDILKELVKHQYELNSRTHETLQEISTTNKSILEVTKEMQRTNECVASTMEKNTVAIESLTKFWGKITYVLIAAIIFLAGVRNLGEILGFAK